MGILKHEASKWAQLANTLPEENRFAIKALAAAMSICDDNKVSPYTFYYSLLYMAMKSYWEDGQNIKLNKDITDTATTLWMETPLFRTKVNA